MLPSVALAVWIVGTYLMSTMLRGKEPGLLLGVIVVMFPAIMSYGTALQFLIGRRLDIAVAVVLCVALGLVGIQLWSAGAISNLQLSLTWLPMYQLSLFVIANYGFEQVMKRSPVSVVFDVGAGKWPDRLFWMSVATLGVLVPVLLLARI